MDGDVLRAAARAGAGLLARVGDPAAPVPVVDTDVRGLVAHVTTCLTWYALDLAAGPVPTGGIRLEPDPEVGLDELRRQLGAAAEVLARVVDAASPEERGAHPWGTADPTGFAAMGCAELLVHTGDVAEALGIDWRPPRAPADATLARLFPWAPQDVDPAEALRWATGRTALAGHERLTSWRWHCAPLTDWDGRRPS